MIYIGIFPIMWILFEQNTLGKIDMGAQSNMGELSSSSSSSSSSTTTTTTTTTI